MEHRPVRRDSHATITLEVRLVADQRVATLGQVNAHLMLTTGLEAALHQRGLAEVTHDVDVGDGLLRDLRGSADLAVPRAAAAVAAIGHEPALDGLVVGNAVGEGQVAA